MQWGYSEHMDESVDEKRVCGWKAAKKEPSRIGDG